MAKNAYVGVDNKAKKIKNIYVGIDNKARKVKKAYVGVVSEHPVTKLNLNYFNLTTGNLNKFFTIDKGTSGYDFSKTEWHSSLGIKFKPTNVGVDSSQANYTLTATRDLTGVKIGYNLCSERSYDKLAIEVNGQTVFDGTGVSSNASVWTGSLGKGHTIHLNYYKDGSNSHADESQTYVSIECDDIRINVEKTIKTVAGAPFRNLFFQEYTEEQVYKEYQTGSNGTNNWENNNAGEDHSPYRMLLSDYPNGDSSVDTRRVIGPNGYTVHLEKGHKYYFSCYVYTDNVLSTFDLYWPILEPVAIRAAETVAQNNVRISSIFDRSNFSTGDYPVRFDCNNPSTSPMKITDITLVDLTATFGAGNEPNVTWCDANIPYHGGPQGVIPGIATARLCYNSDGTNFDKIQPVAVVSDIPDRSYDVAHCPNTGSTGSYVVSNTPYLAKYNGNGKKVWMNTSPTIDGNAYSVCAFPTDGGNICIGLHNGNVNTFKSDGQFYQSGNPHTPSGSIYDITYDADIDYNLYLVEINHRFGTVQSNSSRTSYTLEERLDTISMMRDGKDTLLYGLGANDYGKYFVYDYNGNDNTSYYIPTNAFSGVMVYHQSAWKYCLLVATSNGKLICFNTKVDRKTKFVKKFEEMYTSPYTDELSGVTAISNMNGGLVAVAYSDGTLRVLNDKAETLTWEKVLSGGLYLRDIAMSSGGTIHALDSSGSTLRIYKYSG